MIFTRRGVWLREWALSRYIHGLFCGSMCGSYRLLYIKLIDEREIMLFYPPDMYRI